MIEEEIRLLERIWRSVHELLEYIEGKLGPSDKTPQHVVLHFNQKGNTMSSITLHLGASDTGSITAADSAGNAVPVTFDAGTVVASLADPTTATATVSADQTSVVITANALTAVGTSNTLAVLASVAGVALIPATQNFDVVADPNAPSQVVLTFAAPSA